MRDVARPIHLKIWNRYDLKHTPLEDYPEVNAVTFLDTIHIAYAVCGKECGNREFIVDGQTQVCQRCGKLMFRTLIQKFVIVMEDGSNAADS